MKAAIRIDAEYSIPAASEYVIDYWVTTSNLTSRLVGWFRVDISTRHNNIRQIFSYRYESFGPTPCNRDCTALLVTVKQAIATYKLAGVTPKFDLNEEIGFLTY